MKDLNLPIIKGEDIFHKKSISMDRYLEFVEFNLKYMIDIKTARKLENKLTINVPFSIK